MTKTQKTYFGGEIDKREIGQFDSRVRLVEQVLRIKYGFRDDEFVLNVKEKPGGRLAVRNCENHLSYWYKLLLNPRIGKDDLGWISAVILYGVKEEGLNSLGQNNEMPRIDFRSINEKRRRV